MKLIEITEEERQILINIIENEVYELERGYLQDNIVYETIGVLMGITEKLIK